MSLRQLGLEDYRKIDPQQAEFIENDAKFLLTVLQMETATTGDEFDNLLQKAKGYLAQNDQGIGDDELYAAVREGMFYLQNEELYFANSWN